MRKRLIALLLPAALVALGGCRDSTGSGGTPTNPAGPVSILGTFALQQMGGLRLPVVVFKSDTERLTVVSGSITFNTDSTFQESRTFRYTRAGQSTVETSAFSGMYTTDVMGANVIVTTYQGGNRSGGTLSGKTLTFGGDNSPVIVFSKQ